MSEIKLPQHVNVKMIKEILYKTCDHIMESRMYLWERARKLEDYNLTLSELAYTISLPRQMGMSTALLEFVSEFKDELDYVAVIKPVMFIHKEMNNRVMSIKQFQDFYERKLDESCGCPINIVIIDQALSKKQQEMVIEWYTTFAIIPILTYSKGCD